MMNFDEDSEVVLSAGNVRAVVSPFGGSLRRLYTVGPGGSETDWIWGYEGRAAKKGGQGDVLIPFPGRVRDGHYVFEDETYELERNDKDGPNAIHGFVRTLPWELEDARAGYARFRIKIAGHKGYPFELETRLEYLVRETGLECAFTIRNAGNRRAPVGAGFHPYFKVGRDLIDDCELELPARAMIEFDDKLLPTGRQISLEGTPYDFRKSRLIGQTRFNHCYSRLDRDDNLLSRVWLRSPETGREVCVWMDGSFNYVVIYSGDPLGEPIARRSLAIEPMTCATDAFNRHEWGLAPLDPGHVFRGRYGVALCSPE